MRVVAIIQARMDSSRLPGKVLIPVAGKPLLWHIIYRLRKCTMVNDICLAIPETRANDILHDFGVEQGVAVVRGPEDNVLERYYLAAQRTKADIIIRVNGDVPLIDPDWLDTLISTMIAEDVDWVKGDSTVPNINQGIDPFSFTALAKLIREAGTDPIAAEHISAYFKKHPGFVSSVTIAPGPEYQFEGARMTVDTPADLRFMEAVYRRLQAPAGEVDVREIVKLLRREPDLLKINTHVYQKKPGDISHQVLFRCDGDAGLGFGHIFRCLALADEMREQYGWGITFAMARGEKGFAIVKKRGYRVKVIESGKEEELLDQLIRSTNPGVLVFDSLTELDRRMLDRWRKEGSLIVTVDDPTAKRLAADLAFYPPVPQVHEMNWDGFTGELFSGWQWVILRRECVASSNVRRCRPEGKPAVLVTMGGSDPRGLTVKAVEALDQLAQNFEGIVLLGPGFGHKEALESLLKRSKRRYQIYENYNDLSSLFASADLAVASFGVTAYELAASGVPSVLLGISADHAQSASIFETAGIGINLGLYSDVEKNTLAEAVKKLIDDHHLRSSMSQKASALVDGQGGQRIAKTIWERITSTGKG